MELFFSPERPFALILNVLMSILAVGASVRALLVASREIPAELNLLRRLRGLDHPTRESVAHIVAGSGSVIENRVEDLQALHELRQPVDVASLSAVTTATVRSQLSGADGIGRSLIVLGLFGTLWGLGSAVTNLTMTITPTSMNVGALASAILSTLGGLQTAFGTTLIGLTGALFVGMAVGLARRKQGAFLREFERVMSTRLVPLFDSSEARNLSDATEALIKVEQRVGHDMLQVISTISAEGASLRSRVESDFDRLEDAFERRAQHLIEATGQALSSTLSIIGERDEGEPTLAEYVRAVRNVVSELERSVHSAGALIPQLEERLLRAIEEQRSGLDDVFTRHHSALEPLLQSQAESAAKLTGVADRNIQTTEALAESLSQFAEQLGDAKRRWLDLDEKIIEIGRSCQQGIENGLRGISDELKKGQTANSEDRERIARHLVTFETELRRHLEQVREDRNHVHSQMTELVDVIRAAVETAVLQVGERLMARETSAGRDLHMAIEGLARELRGMVRVAPLATPMPGDSHVTNASRLNRMVNLPSRSPDSSK